MKKNVFGWKFCELFRGKLERNGLDCHSAFMYTCWKARSHSLCKPSPDAHDSIIVLKSKEILVLSLKSLGLLEPLKIFWELFLRQTAWPTPDYALVSDGIERYNSYLFTC